MTKEGIGIYAGSKVTQTLKIAIQKAVAAGAYLNESDFIRDAIKEKLQHEGLIPMKRMEEGEKVSRS